MINIEDFSKVELKVGKILEAEDIEGSERLLKLKVDLGPFTVIPSESEESLSREKSRDQDLKDESRDPSPAVQDDRKRDIRQILAGVKKWYNPEDFIGKQVIVVANLEPRIMMGLESQGMMLAADSEDGPVFLTPSKPVPPGSKIR